MGRHSAGPGAHAPHGRASHRRRRRRRRATGLVAASGTSLIALVFLALGPAFGTPGGAAPPVPAVAVDPSPAVTVPVPELPAAAPTVPRSASGRYVVAQGRTRVAGRGEVVRYLVEMEKGLPFDVAAFAADVHRILNAPGGWGRGGGGQRFERVTAGPVDFRVSLSSPALTDRQCAPLRTYGKVSCFNGSRAVINAQRWASGAPTYGDDLAGYRNYLIGHEVGHALGKGHVPCPRPGALAPIMVQQTKSLAGCRANPWPFPGRAAEGPAGSG